MTGGPSPARDYEGVTRLPYFGAVVGVAMLNAVAAAIVGSQEQVGFVVSALLFGLGLWAASLRLRNIGTSPWWALGLVVPALNIAIAVVCLALPPGFRDHRKLDTAAKVVIALLVALLLLGIAAAVLPLRSLSG
ncbi:MAG: hypothetical protein AAF458_11210 [Pseudomonadota bacterium]